VTSRPPPSEPRLAPRELVLRFLASIGRPAEAQHYLTLFRSEPEKFAVIHVSDAVLRDALDALLVDLRFLADLGLRPVMVFGAVKPKGARRRAERVRDALVPDVPCTVVEPAQAAEAARAGQVALVPLDGVGTDGDDEAATDDRFDALAALVAQLGAPKVVFLGRRSGLQPAGGRVVSLIDLTSERDHYQNALPGKQARLLRQIDRLVEHVPHRITVSVTSPLDLLRELFTVKGAGTLVKRGSRVVRQRTWSDVDSARLGALVEEAFGKPLVAGWNDRALAAAYVADDFRGAAIVTETPLAPYLSKFAVTMQARGEGVGRDLWRAMEIDYPRLYWRSRATNPITAWYREQCDGMVRVRGAGIEWVVLWRGLEPGEIAAAVDYCQRQPPDFVEAG
jgi:acetylglutamate kinase